MGGKRHGRFLKWLPLLILAVGFSQTWLAWSLSHRMETAARSQDFAFHADQVANTIRARLQANEQVLRGVAGLLAADPSTTRGQFRSYVESLRLEENYPCILGVGYALALPGAARDAHELRIRAEGFPDYRVTPTGHRPLLGPIVFLEPFSDRNLRAFGFDMFSEPVRSRAMARARDSGGTAMSGKVTLVQETQEAPQAGFLIYVPVYRMGAPRETEEQRRQALLGWAYSPLRMEDMMRSLMGGLLAQLEGHFRLAIHDGAEASPDGLMFQSEAEQPAPAFADQRRLEFGGHTWTLSLQSLSHQEHEHVRDHLGLVVLAGVGVTLALALMVWMMAHNRELMASALDKAKDANRQLVESRSLLQRIYDTSGVAIFLVDRSGRITHANRSMAEMFARPLESLVGAEYMELVHPDEAAQARRAMLTLMEGKISSVDVERLYHRADGTPFWGNLRGQPIFDAEGSSVGLVGVIANIDDRRRLQGELEWQARTDALTGVHNRRHFLELAEAELARAKRYGTPLAVLMLDVDEFKCINDTHGHAVGDEVLRQLAEICRKTLREMDAIGRMGGEEFAVMLPETDTVQAHEAAERLRSTIAAAKVALPQGLPLKFTVSIGISGLQGRDDNLDTLLSEADTALYTAKRTGRNRVCA